MVLLETRLERWCLLHPMGNIDQRAQHVARAQYGLASRRQLAAAGVGQRAIHRRTSSGVWRVRFGIVIDLARCTEVRQLEIWLWDLARRDPASPARLASRLARVPAPLGSRRLAAVLSGLRPDLALAESPLEIHGLLSLREAGAPPPELQFIVRDRRGRFVARVDAAWPDVRVIVEFDGAAFHRGGQARAADRERLARLRALGWHVIVLSADDLRRPGRLRRLVVDELRVRLQAARAPVVLKP